MPTKAHKAAGGRLCRSLALAWAMVLALPAWGADEYVDTRCALNGNGTAPTCAASGGGAGAWNAGASVTYNTGDVIYLARGTTVTDLPTSVSSQVTLDDYGDASLASPLVVKNSTTFTLSISAADVVLNDVRVSGNQSSAIVNSAAARTVLNRVEIFGNATSGGVGLRFNSTSSDGACNDCSVHDINDDGVNINAAASGTFTLARLECYRVDLGGALGDCVQANTGSVSTVVIDGGNYTKETAFKSAIIYDGSGALIVRNAPTVDVSAGCCNGSDSAQGIAMQGTGVLRVESVYVRGSAEAPAIFATNTGASSISSCIIVGGEAGVWSSHASGTLDVQNCAIREQRLYGIYHTTGGTLNARNSWIDAPANIFDASAAATTTANFNRYGAGTFALDGAAHTTLAAWQAASSQDANSAVTNPQFVGGANPTTAEGFRLSASSPLAGAGTDLGDEIADFFGDYMYNGKWDIGAFRRDSCYRRSRDGKLDMARTRAQVVSRCRGIPGRYPEGL